jgi:hypothetical protein
MGWFKKRGARKNMSKNVKEKEKRTDLMGKL